MPSTKMTGADTPRPEEAQARAFAATERRRADFERRLAAILREWAEFEEADEHKQVLLARAERHEQAAAHHDRAAKHQEEAANRMRRLT